MPLAVRSACADQFRDLPASTCAACLLNEAHPLLRKGLIETFERLALKKGVLRHGICGVCHKYKAVIRPA
jgi:hypothetical protein